MDSRRQTFYLNSLSLNPDFRFSTQENKEVVHLIVREHPITQFPWLLSTLVLIITPFFLVPFLASLPFSSTQITFIILAWYGFTFSFLITKFFIWYFNIGVITNFKAMDVDTHGILTSESSTAFLRNIEEIKKTTSGIWSAVFDYGNIFVQTAGEELNIEFMNTPKPELVVQIINTLIQEHGRIT
ncbi:MAG: hypothetical protein NUV65_03335 [Candidatus Roizmanbacteria bacterium]|nr:hypothetical protein [Candidatus Roizmanbacteria bacterium]